MSGLGAFSFYPSLKYPTLSRILPSLISSTCTPTYLYVLFAIPVQVLILPLHLLTKVGLVEWFYQAKSQYDCEA